MTPLAHHLFNEPLLIKSSKLDAIIAGLGERVLNGTKPEPGAYLTNHGEYKKPGYTVNGGIATIEIFGILAHHGGIQADSSYILGYQTIAKQLSAAVNDSAVKGILMIFDSPGGQVAGAFDLAADIRKAADIKPVWAAVSDLAASAAYLLASAAQRIYVSRTALAGSIGVVMRHVDISRSLDQSGIGVTHVYSGRHKIDGNQFAPLSPAVKADLQAMLDRVYTLFVNTVAAHRGMAADAIRATEARDYMGEQIITKGLADHIGSADQAQADFAIFLKSGILPMNTAHNDPSKRGEDEMSSAKAQALWDKVLGIDSTPEQTADHGSGFDLDFSGHSINAEPSLTEEADPAIQAAWDKVMAQSPTAQHAKQRAELMAAAEKKQPAAKQAGEGEQPDPEVQALWDRVMRRA